jgi:hypothetical protein
MGMGSDGDEESNRKGQSVPLGYHQPVQAKADSSGRATPYLRT